MTVNEKLFSVIYSCVQSSMVIYHYTFTKITLKIMSQLDSNLFSLNMLRISIFNKVCQSKELLESKIETLFVISVYLSSLVKAGNSNGTYQICCIVNYWDIDNETNSQYYRSFFVKVVINVYNIINSVTIQALLNLLQKFQLRNKLSYIFLQ